MPINYATMRRVSTDGAGNQANGASFNPVFSPDGSAVAFRSLASNLVPGDTNGWDDIFLKDLVTGAVTRVSTDGAGNQANSGSFDPVVSPDGSAVAFWSFASNLVAGDTNGRPDIFVKDLGTGAITRVSTDGAGNQADGDSVDPVFSPDGTKVAFYSEASNLVPDDTNFDYDVFVKELATGAITRVSTDGTGNEANGASVDPVFSPDGTKLVFRSLASNLVADDTNGWDDLFLKDLVTGAVTRVSTDSAGNQANGRSIDPVFSPDGTKLAFSSFASNLAPGDTNGGSDVFIKDLVTGTTTLVSTDAAGNQGNGESFDPVFSPDGTKVAFFSDASNLVAGDTNGAVDVFVKDLASGAVTRISLDTAGGEGNGNSFQPVFSPDGTKVAFFSAASNLVPSDTNGTDDIFVVDLAQGGAGNDVLAPLAPGEVVFGHAGDDRFLGSPFGDVFRPGTGADVARLGAGADRVIGTAAELDGDRIEDLASEDAILVEGVRFDRRHVEVELGSAILRIDSDRNGTIDTTITLDGDFSAGRFLVLPSTGGPATTTIRYTLDPNLAPVAADDTASTARTPVVVDILANDSDPDGVLDPGSVTITAPPAFGTVVDNGDGTLTYTPEAGRAGVVDLRYTVEDVEGAVSNEARVTIRVDPTPIDGSARPDLLAGTAGADLIRALAGGDIVDAGAGDDRVAGGDGNDLLRGGEGHDILLGGSGADILDGGTGDDVLLGGAGLDTLNGGSGVDVAVYLGARADYRVLGLGPNRTVTALRGGEGADTLASVERIQFADGWLDTATNAFVPGFANAKVEALLTGTDPWIQP